MTITELAAHDQANRLAVLDAAIAEEYRGEQIRAGAHAHSLANFERNLARLKAERHALLIHMGRRS